MAVKIVARKEIQSLGKACEAELISFKLAQIFLCVCSVGNINECGVKATSSWCSPNFSCEIGFFRFKAIERAMNWGSH
jgi:hypothetical protein